MDNKKYIEVDLVEYRRIKDEREYYRNLTGLMVHALKVAEYELTALQGLEANDNGRTFTINSNLGLQVIQKALNMKPESMKEDITILMYALNKIEDDGTMVGTWNRDITMTPPAAIAHAARKAWEARS